MRCSLRFWLLVSLAMLMLGVFGSSYCCYRAIDGKFAELLGAALTQAQQQAMHRYLLEQLILQLLLVLPAVLLALGLIGGFVLIPFQRIRDALAQCDVKALKPLSVANLPAEAEAVVETLNTLLLRLDNILTRERCFAADAAHELRTPLAGMLAQVQLARKLPDEQAQRQALARMEQAVDNMTQLLQQLLIFSRYDSAPETLTTVPLLLAGAVRQVIAELDYAAGRKAISVEFIDNPAASVLGNPQLLHILLRNLVDNAIKYTPMGGRIRIALRAKGECVELIIEDSGPGIEPGAYTKSLERFRRLSETASAVPGSGLGFDLVRRIAALHRAELSLGESELSGLKVSVAFHAASVQMDGRRISLTVP